MEFERKDPPPIRSTVKPDENAWKPKFVAFLQANPGEWYVGKTILESEPKGRGNINQDKLKLEKDNPGVEATVRTELTSDTDDTKVIRLYGKYIEPEKVEKAEEKQRRVDLVLSDNVLPGRHLHVAGFYAKVENVEVVEGKMVYDLRAVELSKVKGTMQLTLARKIQVEVDD